MCGNLGKWLRLLGYDTTYAKDYEVKYGSPVKDADLINECLMDYRILISGDEEMIEIMNKRCKDSFNGNLKSYENFDIDKSKIALSNEKGIIYPSLLLKNSNLIEEMASIVNKFHIRLFYDSKNARCTKCNSKINKIQDPKNFMAEIPKNVFKYHKDFWICSNGECRKIYWRGNQFENILLKLDRIKELAEN